MPATALLRTSLLALTLCVGCQSAGSGTALENGMAGGLELAAIGVFGLGLLGTGRHRRSRR